MTVITRTNQLAHWLLRHKRFRLANLAHRFVMWRLRSLAPTTNSATDENRGSE